MREFVVKTPHTLAAEAAARWDKQYPPPQFHESRPGTAHVSKSLHALGLSPDPAQVDAIIGNHSWTATKCDQCENERVPVVGLGWSNEYECIDTWICLGCARGAVRALELPAPPAVPAQEGA